ncbi:MAG: histidine triad nucleotide-binding protein [Alphaproteobacteria bacterium]|nr:histidine triad nucleotide-binding protein [Alphaproteobacteria bacterium]
MYHDNIFTRIIAGEIPCDKVYESEYTLAFKDIAPKAPTHILVIPKGKYVDFSDFTARASADEMTDFYRSVARVADEKLPGGHRIIINTAKDGGQEVPHFHAHILGGRTLGPKIVQE